MSVDDGLRPLFRQHVPRPCHWTTIESGFTERGIPDANFCIPSERQTRDGLSLPGYEGWIEMKATSKWEVDLRPEQIGWLKTRARHGGRCFVAVRRRASAGPRRGPAVDQLWLFRGAAAAELKQFGFSSLVRGYEGANPLPRDSYLGCWSGSPATWDWTAVRSIMTSD